VFASYFDPSSILTLSNSTPLQFRPTSATSAFLRELPYNQPSSLIPSLPSSRFTNKLFVLQFEHPSPRFLCVAQRQADCSKPVAMAVRGKGEGKGNPSFFYPLFFIRPPLPTPSSNTRISTHREFNPRAFRERRRFLLGNSALFRSDCERPPPCLSSRWDERTSVFCYAFQFAPSFPRPGTPHFIHRESQRFRNARVFFFAPPSGRVTG